MDLLSIKANWRHAVLEHQIKELDNAQDMTRSGIMERAIFAAQNPHYDWKKIKDLVTELKRRDDIPIPKSMQAKISPEAKNILNGVRKDILNALKDEIRILQTPYLYQLLMLNYREYLIEQKLMVGEEKKAELNQSDMNGAEMVKRLVEILLLNRTKDKPIIDEIKKSLQEWER
ncbi:MAG: hypothetical protein RSE39_08670 [Oscillospiraceae bacterium]